MPYVRPESSGPTETSAARDAITDTTITKRPKQVLLDIYYSLRHQNETARQKPATA